VDRNYKNETVKDAHKYQKINHFPGMMQIGRKDLLWKNVSKFRRMHGMDFEICPLTYVFPEDFKRFIADKEAADERTAIWIMKPSSLSCGRGIKLINKKSIVKKRP
jgi:hypothetical protein